MQILRPIKNTDFAALKQIAIESGHGFTSLPVDDNLLQDKISRSENSFSKHVETPFDEGYLFVLEDTKTNEIVGTTAIDVLNFSSTELLSIASIEGAAGNDSITGSSTDDLIIGGTGNDTLSGGLGSDTYQFSSGDGHDTINNIGTDITEVDTLLFGDVASDDLWLSRSGDNLIVDVVGTDDWVKINDWYADDSNQLDTIEASNLLLHRDQVDQLVNAMAAFDVPDGVGAVVPDDVRQQLEPTLTSVWQVS